MKINDPSDVLGLEPDEIALLFAWAAKGLVFHGKLDAGYEALREIDDEAYDDVACEGAARCGADSVSI